MRTLKTLLLITLALGCRLAPGAESLFEIDGIRLGMPETDVRTLFPAARCSTPKGTEAIDRECVLDKPASETAKRYYFVFLEGRLVTATMRFPASGYDTALKAAQSRYGRPTSLEMNTVPDRSGDELQSAISAWRNGWHVLSLERYSLTLPTHSTLELKDQQQHDIVDERIRKRVGSKGKPR